MPRPWFSKSGLSLCCSTIVPSTVMLRRIDATTSPPYWTAPFCVCTVAVSSPGSGGVMKRET